MKRLRRYFRYRFNLIEIVLAMGVVGIGIAGVMSMMAPALSANRDAVQESVAAEAAGKIMTLIEMTSRRNSNNVSSWYSAMNPSAWSGSRSGASSGYLTLVSHDESSKDAFDNAHKNTTSSDQIFPGLGNDIYLRQRSTTEFFDIVDRAKTKTGEDDTTEPPDVIAHARIYVVQSQSIKTGSNGNATVNGIDPTASSPTTSPQIMRYVIEVSWPTSVSYTSPLRQFRYFTYETVYPGA